MDEALIEINKKLDAIMEHLGCKSMPKKDYMSMPDEDKDNYDEKDMRA